MKLSQIQKLLFAVQRSSDWSKDRGKVIFLWFSQTGSAFVGTFDVSFEYPSSCGSTKAIIIALPETEETCEASQSARMARHDQGG